jgi:F-type H+-transporting ATPase subunit gamma
MANLRDIRRRIKSVKSTAQITRAMQLVAAAKMKKAQDQAIAGRDYANQLNQVLVNLKNNVEEESHPLLQIRKGNKELMLVVSTDKGLCGALNTNLFKKVRSASGTQTHYVTVGRKLRGILSKMGKEMIADFTVKDPVPFAEARPISKFLIKQFLEEGYDRISIAFNNYITVMNQEPTVLQLLPLSGEQLGEKHDFEGVGNHVAETNASAALSKDYAFEPSPMEVLDSLLPLYINFQVYQTLVEARASEHSARMVAMKAATDNAKKFIKELTLEYNKARQAAITSELLEITTAMKAME